MFFLQLTSNYCLFILSSFGIALNDSSILITIMSIELVLLSVNLNFSSFSVYLDDIYGQLFSLFILTIAAAESAIGLSIIINYYRIRGRIEINQRETLKK